MLYLESSADLSVGKKVLSAEIREGSTFGELLDGLDHILDSALAKEIYDPGKQSLNESVLALINGTYAHNFDGLDTVLHQGDSIVFVPLVYGG